MSVRKHVHNRGFCSRSLTHMNTNLPMMAANLLVLAHEMEAAMGGTAPQIAVAIKKYKKFRLMLACTTTGHHLTQEI